MNRKDYFSSWDVHDVYRCIYLNDGVLKEESKNYLKKKKKGKLTPW